MSDESWEDEARRVLAPMVAGTAFVLTIDPAGEIDPKIALETGYAVLLNKPIVVVVSAGRESTPGLERIAHRVIRLTAPLGTQAGQLELQAGLASFSRDLRLEEDPDAS